MHAIQYNTHCHSQGNAWHLHGYVQVYAISWSLPLTAVQPQGYTAINYLDIFILFLFRINVIIIKARNEYLCILELYVDYPVKKKSCNIVFCACEAEI